MNEPIPSYPGKVFTILDNDSRIRNPRNIKQFARYQPGETLPPGRSVGDHKIIRQHTQVHVTDVRTDDRDNLYVFAEPVDAASLEPSGWTRASNLLGQFVNELLGYAPAEWDLLPQGTAYTVVDGNSIVRTGPPSYRPVKDANNKNETLAPGTYVVVTARSQDTNPKGTRVRVSRGEVQDGEVRAVEPLGWTAASNLVEGWSKVFTTDAWRSETGPNGCWRRGKFIGAKILVEVGGAGGQMRQITLDSLPAFWKLQKAAQRSNLTVTITSGFRTFAKQKALRARFDAGIGPIAARPGTSNHQHGQAIDLLTGGFGTNMYKWLTRNAPKHGFIRTVSREPWHWEYRPDEAATLAAEGKFKRASVNP